MKKKQSIYIGIRFINSEADLVFEFYEKHNISHKSIYLKGLEILKKEERK